MRDRYDVKYLDEPLSKVGIHTIAASAVAIVAVAAGLWIDLRYEPGLFGDTPCFQRSGAVTVICGTYLAFRSGAVIIKSIQYGSQKPIMATNEKPSRYYGRAAFCLLFIGTLIWGFGDLLIPSPD